MRRYLAPLLLIAVLMVVTGGPVAAQTDTPTPTSAPTLAPTETATLTPTPDVRWVATLSSGQAVEVRYSVDTGEAVLIMIGLAQLGLLAAIVFGVWVARKDG